VFLQVSAFKVVMVWNYSRHIQDKTNEWTEKW